LQRLLLRRRRVPWRLVCGVMPRACAMLALLPHTRPRRTTLFRPDSHDSRLRSERSAHAVRCRLAAAPCDPVYRKCAAVAASAPPAARLLRRNKRRGAQHRCRLNCRVGRLYQDAAVKAEWWHTGGRAAGMCRQLQVEGGRDREMRGGRDRAEPQVGQTSPAATIPARVTHGTRDDGTPT